MLWPFFASFIQVKKWTTYELFAAFSYNRFVQIEMKCPDHEKTWEKKLWSNTVFSQVSMAFKLTLNKPKNVLVFLFA